MTTTSAQMTSDAKRALSKTIRALRTRLLEDLAASTEQAYRLSIDAKKASLDESARIRRARLDAWVDEQVRALPAKSRAGAVERFRHDLVKDAAATLLQRLVYLRLLESTGLRKVKVVTGGWESAGYADFREAAPELVRSGRDDETEGYATLLALVFDELSIDLPGLYGPVRMTSLVPVPASTLRAVVTALDDEELATVWTDDTTLGWIYQYWNDPEREALDAKLAASKKLENHEIASKTQMFTERYMVEWLLHNSLGQMWLAMCRKHGWVADVARADGGPSVLDRLEARRADWRAKREAGPENGGVALDALMPIEPGLEDRWKYWVPQPMPDDAPAYAPESVRALKLLDPACGSGHFLVIAFELLFHLYQEEARHRGETWTDKDIVESILENNLHGIDIDPRAVQIAAAALMLKARQLCPDAEPRTLNVVAPSLSLAGLAEDDPSRLALYEAVEQETGIPPELTGTILSALAGADHLGSLLKVDAEIDGAIAAWDAQVGSAGAQQGALFPTGVGFGERRRKRITADQARATLLSRLERFLEHHSRGADLGLRLNGEQLAAGVRFVRLIRESRYDVVTGNPPYQGTGKMADRAYLDRTYPLGKADLYAAFLERAGQLARRGGTMALLTMRNWMFIKQFAELRADLLRCHDLRSLGDLDRGAFEDVPDEIVAVVMSILRARCHPENAAVAIQPTPLDDRARDSRRTQRKRVALMAHVGRMEFDVRRTQCVPSVPLLYWWSTELLDAYTRNPLLGAVAECRIGMSTSDNERFVRMPHEVQRVFVRTLLEAAPSPSDLEGAVWVPTIMGGKGQRWLEPLSRVVCWRRLGLEMKVLHEAHYGSASRRIQSQDKYFVPGVAYTTVAAEFGARAHVYRSIFGQSGSSVFGADVAQLVCLLNSSRARYILGSLNPGLGFEAGDVARLPTVEGVWI